MTSTTESEFYEPIPNIEAWGDDHRQRVGAISNQFTEKSAHIDSFC